MTGTDLVDRLAAHQTVGAAPREELEWLAAHGSLWHLDDGHVSTAGAPVEALHIVLTGHVAIFVDRGAGRHKVMEWHAGDVTGTLPYSRMVNAPGDAIAMEPTDVFVVHRDHFPAMIRECQQVTTILVHKMLDRARVFTSSGLHDEKMISLGKLSAGLAHELNNPVSAIERSAALLKDRLEDAELATRALGAARLTDRQLAAVDEVRASCLAAQAPGVLSPIQQAERENAIGDWLADHGLSDSIAGSLAETAVTIEALDRIAAVVDGAGPRRGPPMGGRRLLGARHRVGDPGRRDADLRPGHGHQGIHADGPGDGRRARWTCGRAWATPSPCSGRRRGRSRRRWSCRSSRVCRGCAALPAS